MCQRTSEWLCPERGLLQRWGWIGKWVPEPPCVVTMICILRDWQLQSVWRAQPQTMHMAGRYQIDLWKQVSHADPLGNVESRSGWMLDSESSPWHCCVIYWPLGLQGLGPALQFRAEPGVTRASSICAMAVERLAAWWSVWFGFDSYSREPWGLRAVQHEEFCRNYKVCLWVCLLIQGKYSMLRPLNNNIQGLMFLG